METVGNSFCKRERETQQQAAAVMDLPLGHNLKWADSSRDTIPHCPESPHCLRSVQRSVRVLDIAAF